MQFALLACSSFESAFRIQERLERGKGYEDASMICGSTCVLAILVAGCSIPLFEGTTVLLHQELATQELLQEQLCHVTRTCRCCTYLTSHKSQHPLPYQSLLHALKIKRQGLCSTPIDGALLTRYYRSGYSIAARALISLEQQHPTQEDQTRPH